MILLVSLLDWQSVIPYCCKWLLVKQLDNPTCFYDTYYKLSI